MAEFAAVVGLTASIVQLLDAGKKVADRIGEFQKNRAFAHLNKKLPVMSLTLARIKEAQEHQPFDTQTQEALLGAVFDCQGLITQLDALISRMSPPEADSKFRRAFKGIRSFGEDQKLLEIQGKLDTAIVQLANYHAVDASLTSRMIALKLAENATPLACPSGLTPKADKAIFDVPAQHVSMFVGRKTLMDLVEGSFAKSHTDLAGPNVVILVGMGGQGKTQLALNYCRKHRSAYQAVFWADASSAQAAASSFDKITAILEARGYVNNAPSKKDFVKDYLDGMEAPWMLMFDNYDNPGAFGDIKSYFPSGKGNIIITSRHAESKRLGCPIHVDSLSEDEAMELLLQKSETEGTEANRAEALRIVKKLACLALAVDQAAAYISLRYLPITQFLQRYEQRKEALMSYVPNSPLWEYRRCLGDAEKETSLSVFTTWEMSFSQIEEIDKEQDAIGHFLTLSSYFNPAKISEFIFSGCSAELFTNRSMPDWLQLFYGESVWDEDCFREVVSGLTNLSLIQHYEIETWQEDRSSWFTLHPLVRDWLQLRLSNEKQREYFLEALEVLHATESTHFESSRYQTYLARAELFLHIQALFKYNEMDGLSILNILETHCHGLTSLALFLIQEDGPFAFAEALYLKLIVAYEEHFGEHSALTCGLKINLARLYGTFGSNERATEALQNLLPLFETYPSNEDIMANALCELAKCYEIEKDLTQAERLYHRALATATTPQPRILSGLAGIYRKLGDFVKAKTFIIQSLELYENENDSRAQHDERQLEMIDLAEICHKNGNIEQAEDVFLRALDTCTQGSPNRKWRDHAYFTLGHFYFQTGRPIKAEYWLKEGLKMVKETRNPGNPEGAFWIYRSTAIVGIACLKAENLLEAKSYCLEAKAGFERLEDPLSETWLQSTTQYLAIIDEKLDILNEPTSPSNEA